MSVNNFTGVLSENAINTESISNVISCTSASLTNSMVTINDSKIRATSCILCNYQNITQNLDESTTGTLIIDNIIQEQSYTIKSNKQGDNNHLFILIKY